MNIRELIRRAGVPERQVRYLISEGLLAPPHGGRSNADYDEDHVAQIARYLRLRDLGFPPAAIKLLLQAQEGAPFPIVPGVTLVISTDLLGSGQPVEPLVEGIRSLLTDLLKETSNVDCDAAKTNRN